MKYQITHINNDILYEWTDVPEIKYKNWQKMLNPQVSEDFSVEGYPFFIQIEPTNFCNLSCSVCPAGDFGFKRSKRNMKLDEFKSIIDDMQNYLLFITLWDWGEPLLNYELPEMISYASERGIKTVTSTNCNCNNFHDLYYMEKLLTSGLNTLILAVDSMHQESYQIYRKKGDLNKVLNGIKNVVSLKKRIKSSTILMLRMVVMRQNENEIIPMRKLSRELGVDRFSVKTVNPLYSIEYSDADIIPKNPCYRRYEYKKGTYQRILIDFKCNIMNRQCTIHSNGDVFPCCWWYDDDYSVSNCFDEGGLTKVWNSNSYRNLRKKIFENKNAFHYCRTCSLNYKFSRTGWFYQTVDLTKSRLNQWKYLSRRYLELNLPPKMLGYLVSFKNKIKAVF